MLCAGSGSGGRGISAAHGVPTFAIGSDSLAPRAAAEALGERGFAVWDGNYYAVEIMRRLGLGEGALRIGIVHYNTAAEVARLLESLAEVAAL